MILLVFEQLFETHGNGKKDGLVLSHLLEGLVNMHQPAWEVEIHQSLLILLIDDEIADKEETLVGHLLMGRETPEHWVDILLLDQEQVHLLIVVVALRLEREVVEYFEDVALSVPIDVVQQVDHQQVDQHSRQDLLVVLELHHQVGQGLYAVLADFVLDVVLDEGEDDREGVGHEDLLVGVYVLGEVGEGLDGVLDGLDGGLAAEGQEGGHEVALLAESYLELGYHYARGAYSARSTGGSGPGS